MNTVKYNPELDKSNVPNKPKAHMVSKTPTNKGYKIKLGQKPKPDGGGRRKLLMPNVDIL